MYQIKCLRDIERLKGTLSKAIFNHLNDDFRQLKDWVDQDDEYIYSNFYSDTTSTGAIVILDGSESLGELQEIGLTEGWENVVPEDVSSFSVNGRVWYRVVVVYTDSCTVIFYVKNLPLSIRKFAQ